MKNDNLLDMVSSRALKYVDKAPSNIDEAILPAQHHRAAPQVFCECRRNPEPSRLIWQDLDATLMIAID